MPYKFSSFTKGCSLAVALDCYEIVFYTPSYFSGHTSTFIMVLIYLANWKEFTYPHLIYILLFETLKATSWRLKRKRRVRKMWVHQNWYRHCKWESVFNLFLIIRTRWSRTWETYFCTLPLLFFNLLTFTFFSLEDSQLMVAG